MFLYTLVGKEFISIDLNKYVESPKLKIGIKCNLKIIWLILARQKLFLNIANIK